MNWNGAELLRKFLPSVVAHSPEAEVIVADNASTDNSIEVLKNEFPGVRLIQNKDNGGYSRGYNQALAHVDADYYILLNSDIEVPEGWLAPIIRMMDSDPNIAACQPKIKDYNRKDYFEYAGAAGGFVDTFGFPFCRGRLFFTLEKDEGQYNEACEIFWASGACFVVRKHAYMEAGGLDESLFSHMEEIDLCWRMKNLGYKIMYCPDSEIYHVGGGTLSSGSTRKTFYNFRNNLFMVYKNLPRAVMVPVIFVRLILDGFAALKFLFGGQAAHVWSILRAHYAFYSSLIRLTKERMNIAGRSKRIRFYNAFKGSIAWQYFILGRKTFNELDEKRFR